MKPIAVFVLVVALALAAGCGRGERPSSTPVAAPMQQEAVIPPPPKSAPAYFRDHYAHLDDCVYDWGYAQKCTPVAPGSQAAATVAFLGPIYARSYREETQVQLRKEALEGGYAQRVAVEASDRSIAKVEVRS
jgi:hypothetical protein